MSDALKLAMRISAVDLFSGVLRRFRHEVTGSGADAKRMQRDYDQMIRHTSAGLKSLAVGGYMYAKLKPAVKAAADLQESMLAIEGVLQGSHPHAKKLADEMDRVKRNSIEVSNHMKYGATAVNQVTLALLQGGVPLNAILGGKRGAAFSVEALSEIRHKDPFETAANVANVGHSFQLRPNQYGYATDIIARASVLGSGGLTQLFHNLDQVGSRAHMFGNMDLKSTAIALKALSPLGEEAGSDLGAALQVMTGGSRRGQRYLHRWGLNFYDKKGHFIGLDASLAELHKKMAHQTQQQRNIMLGEVFGSTGSKAITQLLAPSMPGVKSYPEMKAAFEKQAHLSQQVAVWEKGLNASKQELESTNENTLAVMFDPMISKLTEAVKLANKLDGEIGKIAEHHRGLADTVSITAAGGILAAGGYGAWRLSKAIGPGRRLLKGILGKAGRVAGGIAEGKAVQAATGVAPVFVTNWPANLGAGTAVAAAEKSAEKQAAKQAAAGGIGATLRGMLGYALPITAGAGGAYVFYKQGHHYGHAVKAAQDSWDASQWKKGGRYAALQPEGEKRHLSAAEVAARRALEKKIPYGAWYEKHSDAYHWWENSRPINDWKRMIAARADRQLARQQVDVGGTLHIELDDKGRARLTHAKMNVPDVNVSVGHMMEVP